MKTKSILLSALLLASSIAFTSCKDNKEETPAPQQETLYGTWVRLDHVQPDGRKVFKVATFDKNNVLKIAYRWGETDELYTNIGEFTFMYQHPNVWVESNQFPGEITKDGFFFGGEMFSKRK